MLLVALGSLSAGSAQTAAAAPATVPTAPLQQVLTYIHGGWDQLTRSPQDCETVLDKRNPANSVLYLPAGMAETPGLKQLAQRCGIHVDHLPEPVRNPGQLASVKFSPQGLLYLPNAYVVPGGFFNEMYGWDSYFIILGLLEDHRVQLARGMVDNFLFEIENYGAVLNANRTYFLSRSQPPFLTSMILAVHCAQQAEGKNDKEWLARAYRDAVLDYDMWTRAPHLAGDTGLSRYYDFGEGPAPEITDIHDPYYLDVANQLFQRPALIGNLLSRVAAEGTPKDWPRFTVSVCPGGNDEKCPPTQTVAFTADYYKGDRSDRESGFDITFRFGPFAAATHHYAAVGLNSLLYKTENDLAELSALAGHSGDAPQWRERAARRRAAVDKYLWDPKAGMYFDYDFTAAKRSSYVYATTFYPLWAGMASPQQARAVAANLKRLERPGGLATSDFASGVQWDLPYGWAPLQLLSVEGLRHYGFAADANRLSLEFLSDVMDNFRRDGAIREKYNVVTRTTETNLTAGYRSNVIGFGWTNGVFLRLLRELPPSDREKLK